jgi:hypothetical protein
MKIIERTGMFLQVFWYSTNIQLFNEKLSCLLIKTFLILSFTNTSSLDYFRRHVATTYCRHKGNGIGVLAGFTHQTVLCGSIHTVHR